MHAIVAYRRSDRYASFDRQLLIYGGIGKAGPESRSCLLELPSTAHGSLSLFKSIRPVRLLRQPAVQDIHPRENLLCFSLVQMQGIQRQTPLIRQ